MRITPQVIVTLNECSFLRYIHNYCKLRYVILCPETDYDIALCRVLLYSGKHVYTFIRSFKREYTYFTRITPQVMVNLNEYLFLRYIHHYCKWRYVILWPLRSPLPLGPGAGADWAPPAHDITYILECMQTCTPPNIIAQVIQITVRTAVLKRS